MNNVECKVLCCSGWKKRGEKNILDIKEILLKGTDEDFETPDFPFNQGSSAGLWCQELGCFCTYSLWCELTVSLLWSAQMPLLEVFWTFSPLQVVRHLKVWSTSGVCYQALVWLIGFQVCWDKSCLIWSSFVVSCLERVCAANRWV